MAYEVVMPQLGLSMDRGQIMQWLKHDGDRVQPGDLLLEVESDKSTVEVEAVEGGILRIVQGPDDGPIVVGNVIAYLLAEGEPMPVGAQPVTQAVVGAVTPAARDIAPTANGKDISRAGPPLSSPAARRRAQELGVDWRVAVPSGPRGQIKERDVLALAARGITAAASAPTEAVRISPLARRMAEEAEVDISALAGRHPGKRLERSDIEGAIRQAVLAPMSAVGVKPATRQPASSLRRLIAERMALSAHTTAAVTLTTEADATDLVRMREGLKADPRTEVAPGYSVLFVALVGRALAEHPYMNASLEGNDIVTWGTANIGVAVDTERGLVVPVVRDAQAKSVRVLTVEMNDLLARASQGKAVPDELKGGTFTITNLGIYEIDAFTPIINPPECAVLGVGRLVERIVPLEGQPAVRTMVALSLTFDHRLVDGAPAAQFLQRVKQFVERPYLWLV